VSERRFEDTAELVLAPTRSWAFVVVLTASFALVEAWLVRSGRYIHDEGLLTWMYASYLSDDPVATLFFLKAKPALAALNLPGAVFGLSGFYVGHVVIACAGIVAIAAAARAARVREWGIAALLFACSPMFVAGTAAGFSNVDAAALTAVALWLIFRSVRPGFGTAAVLSLLPWIRFEASVFVGLSGLALLVRDRNPRFLLGLFALPVAYLSAGAVWHHDVLWFWHFPATFAHLAQTGVFGAVEDEARRTSVADLAFAFGTVTPALALALVPGVGAPRWVPVGQLCTVLFLGSMALLPRLGAAMGYSQRYFLQILPVVALLAAHRLEQWPRRTGVVALAAITACLGALVLGSPGAGNRGWFSLVALAGMLVFLALAWRGAARLAIIGLAVFALAWPFSGLPLDVLQPLRHRMVAEAVDWLRTHPEQRTPVVITNMKMLDAALAYASVTPPVEVRCLIQKDNEYELTILTDPANGQRARIFALVAWRFYGKGIIAEEFAEYPEPSGALVVLQRDARLDPLNADTLAADGATVLLRSGDLSILRLP
jgi:hypothetical protein